MKVIKIILITFLTIVLSSCGTSQEANDIKALDPVERESSEEDKDGFKEVDVEENNAKETDNESNRETEKVGTKDAENSEISEENSALISNDNSEEELLETDEYQILDLSEIEDENNYETGLVFIVQEGDIWRVVDRTGNIYRVSTSSESAVQGIVNVNATVTKDKEGNAKVSLSRDYEKYENFYILKVDTNIEEEFSIGLLDMQLNASATSKIDSYTLNQVSSANIGKGIRIITMNFNVVASGGAIKWGSSQEEITNITYTYTVYGYEKTWILPIKAPMYKDVSALNDDENASTKLATEEEVDENLISNDNGNSGISQFSANELQGILAEVNGKIYYTEKELLSQAENLIGTDIYEHSIRLFEFDTNTGNTRQIVKGEKNGNYSLIKIYDNKMFLTVMEQTPSAGGSLIGLSFINLDELSYRSIYKGQVANGINLNDKAYIFTNDNLIEIDLVNASIRIVSNLPEHLTFDTNSIKAIGIEDSLLTVEISYEIEAITYTIHILNGETTEIESFIF